MGKISKVMFHIHSLGHGGAEHVVLVLAGEMAKRGIKVWIATTAFYAEEYPIPEGVERIPVGTTEEEEKLGSGKKRELRRKRLRDALEKEKPDVLLSFCRGANYRAVLAAKGTGIPVIISVRSNPEVDYGSRIHKFYSRYLYRKAAGAVFQTTGARDYFPEDIAGRSAVILNPISEKFLNKVYSGERTKRVVSVGRFHDAKDYMTLVKAFEQVAEKRPEYVLEIYGDKSDDNTIFQVKEWVRSHRMEEKILFMGNRRDIPERIRDAACYVLSSKYEGMPNALMEAMALGMPVVSTDCPSGGPAAIIEDGENGLLAETGNDKELATAIGKMLDYPEEAARLAKEAAKLAEKASVKVITDEWLSYAEKCILQRKTGG